MFDMFIVKRWSFYKIAKEFNRLRIDDWDRWSDVSIEKTLTNPAYIGLFVWNKRSKVYDWTIEREVSLDEMEVLLRSPTCADSKSVACGSANGLFKPKSDPHKQKRRQPQRLASAPSRNSSTGWKATRSMTSCWPTTTSNNSPAAAAPFVPADPERSRETAVAKLRKRLESDDLRPPFSGV